ncbi:MAG TPA: hypothetical protein VI753_13260 [Anaerolineales bacterium]|nr:hypothetical protein [Anaerolineales bacterium]
MSQPASNQNEPSKMKKLLNGNMDETIKMRLPRANGPNGPTSQQRAVPVSPSPERESRPSRYKFLPAFWTIASVISLGVNLVLIVILLIVLQMLGTIQLTADDQVSGLLGGLYGNFVKMDEANIRTNIHVEKEIPVQFTLNVSGPTNVTLSQDVTINGALVTVGTGGLNIVNARATIVLPKDTLLPINIQNLVVPVDQRVLAVLDVPVDIPLDQTELHDPFVGLQQVVKPWYCIVEPNAVINNVQVCPPISTQP